MGRKGFDPAMIRYTASEIELARDGVNRLGNTMARSVDASIMGALIASQVEALAANLAAMVLQLDELALGARAAASRYERAEEGNVDEIERSSFSDDQQGSW
ncbi:MAG TPA: hypothetical protein VI076_06970 [Actinopolymorphaceae bacterium]